jgi:hypothetical protein
MISLEKIEDQEDTRYDRIVDAVFEEGVSSRRKKTEMTAEQNKCRNIPAQEKHTYRNTYDRKADRIDIPKVFGCKVK